MKRAFTIVKRTDPDADGRGRVGPAATDTGLRYRRLFESVQSGILTLDASTGVITDINPYLIGLLGYSREEFVGRTPQAVEAFTATEAGAEAAAALSRHAHLRDNDVPLKAKDGRLIHVALVSDVCAADSESADSVIQCHVRDHGGHRPAAAVFTETDPHHPAAGMEALHIVGRALRVAQTPEQALPVLLDEALTAMDTDAGAIWLHRPGSDDLHAIVARGWFRQYQNTPLKPGEGLVGSVFASGQTLTAVELTDHRLVRELTASQFPTGWAGVCVPIRTGAITIGTLAICLPTPRRARAEQVKLLESLADMGGAALHRMRLHEEAVRQVDRLATVHSIDRAIASSVDLRMTLDILVEKVTTHLAADAAVVTLIDAHSHLLEYALGRGFRTDAVRTRRTRLGDDVAGRAALERRTVCIDDPAQVHSSPQYADLWAREGFAAGWAVPLIAKGEVKGVLEVYQRSAFHAEPHWLSFLETVAGQAAIAIDSAHLFEHLQRSNADLALAYDATIEGWSRALDLRDNDTEGHTRRVAETTVRLGRTMGISEADLVQVRRGALLHDIGKISVPDRILLKPGPLTEEEWAVMRRHPKMAYDMLSPVSYLRQALDIPYCHHEKWDGSGYPRGLKADQIPLAARVFAVVDVWDALRSNRPYRPAWPADTVIEHIRSLSGIHFDPDVVRVFLEHRVFDPPPLG